MMTMSVAGIAKGNASTSEDEGAAQLLGQLLDPAQPGHHV